VTSIKESDWVSANIRNEAGTIKSTANIMEVESSGTNEETDIPIDVDRPKVAVSTKETARNGIYIVSWKNCPPFFVKNRKTFTKRMRKL